MFIKRRLFLLSMLFSLFFSINIYAMPKNLNTKEPISPTPLNDSSFQDGNRWTWVNDNLCVQFRTGGPVNTAITREQLQKRYDLGLLNHWYEDGKIKERETYSGKWSQDEPRA